MDQLNAIKEGLGVLAAFLISAAVLVGVVLMAFNLIKGGVHSTKKISEMQESDEDQGRTIKYGLLSVLVFLIGILFIGIVFVLPSFQTFTTAGTSGSKFIDMIFSILSLGA